MRVDVGMGKKGRMNPKDFMPDLIVQTYNKHMCLIKRKF